MINLYAVNVLTESESEKKFDVNVLDRIKSNVQTFFALSKQLLAELSYSSLRKNAEAFSKLVHSFGSEVSLVDQHVVTKWSFEEFICFTKDYDRLKSQLRHLASQVHIA